jgi:hypothetical protein
VRPRRVDAERRGIDQRHVRTHAGLKRTQLFELLAPLYRQKRKKHIDQEGFCIYIFTPNSASTKSKAPRPAVRPSAVYPLAASSRRKSP